MKIAFSILAATLCCNIIQAQELTALVYSAEGNNYYKVSGAVPQSAIAFYSEAGGGQLMLSQPVNGTGSILYRSAKNFTPAFVLNTDNPETGKNGSNKVFHFSNTKEFTIEDIRITQRDDKTVLCWNAAVADRDAYEFDVLKSRNGKDFFNIAAVAPQSIGISAYEYADENKEIAAYYKIQVRGKKNDVNYYSKKTLLYNDNAINIYPTVFTSYLMVELSNLEKPQPYRIENLQGQSIQEGIIKDVITKLELKDLSAGIYFIKIQVGKDWKSRKIVKN